MMSNRRSKSKKSTPKKVTKDVPKSTVHQSSPSSESFPTPQWFSWALSESFESTKVPVEDQNEGGTVDIHCMRWGSSKTKRGLIMIHGGGANAAWYRFIAPFFSSEFDVVAITNSGNGDSCLRKSSYTLTQWSLEILTCTEKLGLFDEGRPRPYIVAHSLGCYVTLNLLREVDFPGVCQRFGGLILTDGAIRPYELSETVHKRVMELRANDPTLKPRESWNINPPSVTPLSRFKLRPFQDCENSYIMKFIAEAAREIVDDDGSWCWKGDCNRDAKVAWESMPILCDKDVLQIAMQIPVTFIYGEDSVLCDVSVVEFVRTTLGKFIGIIGIPCAAHHVWLDQPLPFITALRGVFAAWPSDDDNPESAARIDAEDLLRREAMIESRL